MTPPLSDDVSRIATAVAARLAPPGRPVRDPAASFEDLRAVATTEAWLAEQEYDPGRGVALGSFLYFRAHARTVEYLRSVVGGRGPKGDAQRRARVTALPLDDPECRTEIADAGRTEAAVDLALVLRLVDRLPPGEAAAVRSRIDDEPFVRVAVRSGVTEARVSQRLHSARQRLRHATRPLAA